MRTAVAAAVIAMGCSGEPAPKVELAAAPAAQDAINEADWVDVPGGERVHKSCIHEAPEGSVVGDDLKARIDGRVVKVFPPCGYPVRQRGRDGDVQQYAVIPSENVAASFGSPLPQDNFGYDWVRYLGSNWKVPVLPKYRCWRNGEPTCAPGGGPRQGGYDQQVLYFMAGAFFFRPDGTLFSTAHMILQFGFNGEVGTYGKYTAYTMISYSSGTRVRSSTIAVLPGDKLYNWVEGTNCGEDGACSWHMETAVYRGSGTPGTYIGKREQNFINTSVSAGMVARTLFEKSGVRQCEHLPQASPWGTRFWLTEVWGPGDGDPNGYNDLTEFIDWVDDLDLFPTPDCHYSFTPTGAYEVFFGYY